MSIGFSVFYTPHTAGDCIHVGRGTYHSLPYFRYTRSTGSLGQTCCIISTDNKYEMQPAIQPQLISQNVNCYRVTSTSTSWSKHGTNGVIINHRNEIRMSRSFGSKRLHPLQKSSANWLELYPELDSRPRESRCSMFNGMAHLILQRLVRDKG